TKHELFTETAPKRCVAPVFIAPNLALGFLIRGDKIEHTSRRNLRLQRVRVSLHGVTPVALTTVVVPYLGPKRVHLAAERLPYKLLRTIVLAKENVRPFIKIEPIDALGPAMPADIGLLFKNLRHLGHLGRTQMMR